MIKLQLLGLALLMQPLTAESPSSLESENTKYENLEDDSSYDFHEDTYESFTPDMEKAVSKEKIFKDDFSTTYEIRHGKVDVSATVENPNAPPDWEEEWHKNGSNKKSERDSKDSSDTSKKENNKRKKGSSFSVTWSSKD
ncbi:MAG: hypothetical protein NTX49_06375 [Chlamydiae bacterium]|nr:hypothetical protein [Chlamydiota bacterium]